MQNVRYKTFDENKEVTYIVFEPVETSYYNKKGELVSYKRVAQVDKKATLNDIHSQLMASAKNYLLHRHFVTTDKHFWSKF